MFSPRLRVAALLLGLAVTFSGCSLFKSSSAPDDSVIVAEIQSKLYQDPVLKTRDIRVISQKGVVVLTGTVDSGKEKTSIEDFAQTARGVKQVIDELNVSSTPMAAAQAPATAAPEHPRRRPRSAMAVNQPPPVPPAEESTAAPEAAAPAPVVHAPPAVEPSSPPPPPQPVQVTLPAGTVIAVQTVDPIDSSVNHPGDEFAATVASPVLEDGQIIIPRYSNARIRLVSVRSAGRIKGRSDVELTLINLKVKGKSYAVDASVYQQQAATSRGKRSAEVIGGGAGLGALIGAIAGGGKGAAIGAAIGAGGGTAVQAGTKGSQVKIPSETKLNFTLRRPITLTLPPQSLGQPQN
ncbi:MAG TPA: BON domain-containing protein [Terriglobia bacterium]|nr:BON domain-containing protein [Terriglobia bacterium]